LYDPEEIIEDSIMNALMSDPLTNNLYVTQSKPAFQTFVKDVNI